MIVAEGLVKKFGAVKAVDRADLMVEAGQIFGLVGPDGAGKTTLMRMICGLITPDQGRIAVLGQTPEQVKEAGGALGYMPQRFSLYGDLTVKENIDFFGGLYQIDQITINNRADQILTVTNLIDFKSRFADQLSGGMKQKLALTCALITRPKLLILDEPTYGVDPESRKEFWKILYQLNQEGMTIMVSTPYMDEAELCHTVAFMIRGKITAVNTPQYLKEHMKYHVLEVRTDAKDPMIMDDISGVFDSAFFGDKFHVMVEDIQYARAAIIETLGQKGYSCLSVEEIRPSMEEVFVAMVEKEVG
ncbi:MAG: ABC transporter ATP-binding protein [Syntrophomonadaceae bacterium]|nr:ABC transporter ATP-binding protein [Syntrophomonadaceae bacterium]